MSLTCQKCGENLPDEYEGELPEGTPCPHCGNRLVRNRVVSLSGAVFGVSFADATLTVRTYPEGLLEEVADLIVRGKFTLAVVTAQMACEVSTERALTRAFEDKKVDEPLRDAITKMLSGRSITNGKVKSLYEALTGKDTLTDLKNLGIWDGLLEMAKWRNGAVHRGEILSKPQAERSLQLATELVKYFKL